MPYILESIDYKPFLTGSAQPKLNKSQCENIPVPVPPLDVQAQLVEKIQQIEESQKQVAAQIVRLKALKRSLYRALLE